MSTIPRNTRRHRPAPAMWAKLRFGPDEPLDDRRFQRLCRDNPDLRLERTAGGELVVMSPADSNSGRRNSLIIIRLGIWNEANGLGIVFESSSGFTLPNGAIRAPDASWIARDRWEGLTPAQRDTYAPICPDFVVELRSPSDSLAELQCKMQEYLAQGARLGWMIDPARNVVEIYRPGREVETLKSPASLSGEDVLPGFVLDLKGILDD
ncbi:MAG: Uma2 family endonuclease [Isosphaeraceae bacterium]